MNLMNDKSEVVHKVITFTEVSGKAETTTACGKFIIEGCGNDDYSFVKNEVTCKSCLRSRKEEVNIVYRNM